MVRQGTARREAKGPLSREEIEAAALRYLNRFDTSSANLKRVLLGYVKRVAEERGADAAAEGESLVEQVLSRYRESGLVNDERFAGGVAAGLRRKGSSSRAIVDKLRSRGIPDEIAKSALDEVDTESDGDPELDAARALARRRRLGAHRPEADRAKNRRRDLGALARAGFGLDVARRALGESGDDDEW